MDWKECVFPGVVLLRVQRDCCAMSARDGNGSDDRTGKTPDDKKRKKVKYMSRITESIGKVTRMASSWEDSAREKRVSEEKEKYRKIVDRELGRGATDSENIINIVIYLYFQTFFKGRAVGVKPGNLIN